MYAVNRILRNGRVVREGTFTRHKEAMAASAWYKRRGIRVRIERINKWQKAILTR